MLLTQLFYQQFSIWLKSAIQINFKFNNDYAVFYKWTDQIKVLKRAEIYLQLEQRYIITQHFIFCLIHYGSEL